MKVLYTPDTGDLGHNDINCIGRNGISSLLLLFFSPLWSTRARLKAYFGQQAVPVILTCCWSVLCGADSLTNVYEFSDVHCMSFIHAVYVCVVWEPNGRGADMKSVALILESWWQHVSVTPLIQINSCKFLIEHVCFL